MNNLVGWTITQALEFTYGHHYYSVGGKVFKQADGGPQGLDTAVECSEVYMLEFDRGFLLLLNKLGLKVWVYVRYVDDITVVAPAIKHGWDYDPVLRKMVYSNDMQWESPDIRTMKVLQKIANSLDRNLQFTVDCPGLQESRKLPILDITVWVD